MKGGGVAVGVAVGRGSGVSVGRLVTGGSWSGIGVGGASSTTALGPLTAKFSTSGAGVGVGGGSAGQPRQARRVRRRRPARIVVPLPSRCPCIGLDVLLALLSSPLLILILKNKECYYHDSPGVVTEQLSK